MSQSAYPGAVRRDDPQLTERQRRVFLALLRVHLQTASPVASETLALQGDLRWSSAHIRGVLGELESLGMVQRAHASAARVPSAGGYAHYVRSELTPQPAGADLVDRIDENLRRSAHDVEQLLHEASRLLSTLTSQMGLAVTWSLDVERLMNLEINPVDARRLLLVLRLGTGTARTLMVPLESPLSPAALEDVASVLRERLMGRHLSEVLDRLERDPELVRDSAVRMVARSVLASWKGPRATSLYSAGAGHIAGQPEFAGNQQLGPLLSLVDQGPPLDRLMVDSVENQLAVRVGLDEDQALQGMSLVSFVLPGTWPGAVGVLGPLRMDYARVMAVVDAVGSRVAHYL